MERCACQIGDFLPDCQTIATAVDRGGVAEHVAGSREAHDHLLALFPATRPGTRRRSTSTQGTPRQNGSRDKNGLFQPAGEARAAIKMGRRF